MAKKRRGESEGQACSASTIVFAAAASGYHLLKVDGYLRSMMVPTGTVCKSRPFTVGGRSWIIHYYPNGTKSDCADHISIFLHLQDHVAQFVKAFYRFSLLDKTGKPTSFQNHSSNVQLFLNGVKGFDKFIKKEVLQASGHVKDDAFTIRCDVTVLDEVRTEDAQVPAPTPLAARPSDLARHLGGLFMNGHVADVTFSVGGGETVAAHRCVLAARSPVFKAELLGAMKESTTADAIPIDDMEANVFKAMLYIHLHGHVGGDGDDGGRT